MSEDQSEKLQKLLKLLSLADGDTSKLTQQQRKRFEEYKFWKTQPVTKFDENIDAEGPIDSRTSVTDIPENPLPLLGDFEWITLDFNDSQQLSLIHI